MTLNDAPNPFRALHALTYVFGETYGRNVFISRIVVIPIPWICYEEAIILESLGWLRISTSPEMNYVVGLTWKGLWNYYKMKKSESPHNYISMHFIKDFRDD
jgi:hypothetical protein